MEELIIQSQLYYRAAFNVDYARMKEILEGCQPMVFKLRDEGKTFEDVITFVEEQASKLAEKPMKANRNDVFLNEINNLFNTVVAK